MTNVSYSAQGVYYDNTIDDASSTVHQRRGRDLNARYKSTKIYVDDGSNGTNLAYSYSYKVYNEESKPSVTNHYTNNYPQAQTSNTIDDAVAATRLHPTADSGGYSDYLTIRKH